MDSEWVKLIEALPQVSAAIVLSYVLKLFVDGRIHSTSEITGLRDDKKSLSESNHNLTEALRSAHQQLDRAHELLHAELRR